MQDNTLVILGLVGLALVCAGLFLVIGLTLFRVTGHRLLGFFSLLTRDAADEVPSQSHPPASMPDLRSIAKAQDFDSAMARHGAAPVQTPPIETASLNTEPTPRLGSRRSTRPAPRYHDDDDDDLFGGLLEDEET